MRLKIVWLFPILGFLACDLLLSQTTTDTSSKIIPTATEVRTAVTEAVQQDPRIIQFYWKKEGQKYYYQLQSIEKTLPKLPIGPVVRTQLVAEVFKARPKQEGWQPYIIQLEKSVENEISKLQTTQTSTQRSPAFVPDAQKTIKEMFDRYAKMNGATEAVNDKTPMDIQLEKLSQVRLHEVEFKTSKPGGRVYFVTAFDYWILKKLGNDKDLTQWEQPVDNKANISGSYIFQVQYSAETKITGKMLIDKQGEIVLP
ncbi:MAG: hypothetical protein ABSE63_18885 [Thermoguttaceae bacterium]|jgi:hypothetical protein